MRIAGGRRPTRRMVATAATAGAGAAAAAWFAQHRAVGRAVARAQRDAVDEGLSLPDDLVHHHVTVDDGATIHVVERGRGPVLLLLHGIMLSSDLWVHQFTDVAARHRVVAVDLRGHGGSSQWAHQGGPAIVRMADDVRAVAEALDLRDALLVGHSMGGMVALQLLQAMPDAERRDRFRGAVLTSTSATPATASPGSARVVKLTAPMTARAALIAERTAGSRLPVEDLRWWFTRLAFGPEPVPAQVRFVEEMHRGAPPGTLSHLVPSLALLDLSAGLADLDVPALVVVGSHDHLTPPVHARRLVGALPRAELVELPRCGHMPMLERRHEFSRLLEEFCAKLA